MNELIELLPTKLQQVVLAIGGAVGAMYGFLFHDVSKAFAWLFIMVAVDYITGMFQAFKNKNWSSKTGFKGLCKKAVIITIVILFHGMAEMIDMPALETTVIFAFALNEMCSILENLERAGFGEIIPAPIRKILDIVETKVDEKIDQLK